jgi:hypothetical protein
VGTFSECNAESVFCTKTRDSFYGKKKKVYDLLSHEEHISLDINLISLVFLMVHTLLLFDNVNLAFAL